MLSINKKERILSTTLDVTQQLNVTFSSIKDELNEHLDSINENTSEINANYESLCEMDSKIDKLTERLDQIQLFLQKNLGLEVEEKPQFNVEKLTKREEEVFLVLYTLDGSLEQITYNDIAKRCGLTPELVMSYIQSMVKKGVPIIKKHKNNATYLKLNPIFRNLQTKENILKINQKTLF